MMRLVTLSTLLATAPAFAFQAARSALTRSSRLFDAAPSVERDAPRADLAEFQGWAAQCGVQTEGGLTLRERLVEGNEDWFAVSSAGAAAGSWALYVPGEICLSAARIAREYDGYVGASLAVLDQSDVANLKPQFHLFFKILMEFEQGENSPYYPWLSAMPRKWNTAVSMDDFCLSCLPPYILSVCKKERSQLGVFREAIQAFEYISPEAKLNQDLLTFAYNVVFSRALPTALDEEGEPAEGADLQITPMADMFNHAYPPNVALQYDEAGNCQATLLEDVGPGTPLTVSYGQPTNPSRFLATYGFLNEATSTYCKIIVNNPSQEILDLGYTPSRMLFDTQNGAIAPEVWDVMLFSRLERKPDMVDIRNTFYQAHMSGDADTKAQIHAQFSRETTLALMRHVDFILAEVEEIKVKMYAFDSSKHPRLPLLRKHHTMVTDTFYKVRDNLSSML